ncbi:MAG: prepilin-type N-terminal cleavage/methylation domain-containing protein [Thermodesulfobacteriota bacterium]
MARSTGGSFPAGRGECGLTLIEIVTTLVIAGILMSIFARYMATSTVHSQAPLDMVHNELLIQQVMEQIIADYREALANDTFAVATASYTGYSGNGTTVTQGQIAFNGNGDETSCASGCRLLKVTVSRGMHSALVVLSQ